MILKGIILTPNFKFKDKESNFDILYFPIYDIVIINAFGTLNFIEMETNGEERVSTIYFMSANENNSIFGV
jgi:hypothetical protein